MNPTTCQKFNCPSLDSRPRRRLTLPGCRRAGSVVLGVVMLAAADPAGAEASHPVFDLTANRTLAHLEQRGGLVIAAGSPGFARYQHFGRPSPTWRLRAEVDGKPVALAQASAKLDVPLTPAQAQSQTVFLSLKSPSRSSVKLSVNGKASQPVTLNPGWQVAQVQLPPDALAPGENNLTLTFAQVGSFPSEGKGQPGGAPVRAAAAVQWLQLGGTPRPRAPCRPSSAAATSCSSPAAAPFTITSSSPRAAPCAPRATAPAASSR